MKRVFLIMFLSALTFVSCSDEDQQDSFIEESNFEILTEVDAFVKSPFYKSAKQFGLEIDLNNYQIDDSDDLKIVLFDMKRTINKNTLTKGLEEKIVAVYGKYNIIQTTFVIGVEKDYDKSQSYSGVVLLDYLTNNYKSEILHFNEGKVIKSELTNLRSEIIVGEDGEIIDEDNGDEDIIVIDDIDPINSESDCRFPNRLGICIGNTIENQTVLQAAACYPIFLGCLARITAGCKIEGCPFDGIDPSWPFD